MKQPKYITFKKLINFIIIYLVFCNSSFSQNKCSFDENDYEITSCLYNSNSNFDFINGKQIIDDILKKVGAKNYNFISIPCYNINNAIALNDKGVNYILYDPMFLEQIKNNSPSSFSNLFILSHEIAHHILGHTLLKNDDLISSKLHELEADKFAGFVLAKFGGNKSEFVLLFNKISNDKSDVNSTHPSMSKRISEAEKGYEEGVKSSNRFILDLIKSVPYNPESLEYLVNTARDNVELWLNSDNSKYFNVAIEYYKKAIQNYDFLSAEYELSDMYYFNSEYNDEFLKLEEYIYNKTNLTEDKINFEADKIQFITSYTPKIDTNILNINVTTKNHQIIVNYFKILAKYMEYEKVDDVKTKIYSITNNFLVDFIPNQYDKFSICQIYNSVGLIFLHNGSYTDAEKYFKLSYNYLDKSELEYKIAYEKYIYDYASYVIKYNIALTLMMLKDYNESLPLINQLINSKGEIDFHKKYTEEKKIDNIKNYYFVRGRCYLGLNKFEDAINDFNNIITNEQCNEKNAVYFYYRGISYLKINKVKACYDFNESCSKGHYKTSCQNIDIYCN